MNEPCVDVRLNIFLIGNPSQLIKSNTFFDLFCTLHTFYRFKLSLIIKNSTLESWIFRYKSRMIYQQTFLIVHLVCIFGLKKKIVFIFQNCIISRMKVSDCHSVRVFVIIDMKNDIPDMRFFTFF